MADTLLEELDEKQKEELKALNEDELVEAHFGLRMCIRNQFANRTQARDDAAATQLTGNRSTR